MKKKVVQKTLDNPFDIRDGRAMVSLGPLSQKKYCSYSCPFCYVNAGFLSYATMTIAETVEWLKSHAGDFNIIYVSGDTDSFAPPRTDQGIELLEAVGKFDVDLLFTTRALFEEKHLRRIKEIRDSLSKRGKLMFGCVSVAQLNHPALEPEPIASPLQRIAQLEKFKVLGLVSVLAMRPFLPVVPVEEYLKLVSLVAGKVDSVLGEVWYADQTGILEGAVFSKYKSTGMDFVESEMDFDDNESIWRVYESKEVEIAVSEKCAEMNIPFFMRSSAAVSWARKKTKGHSNDLH